MMCDGLVVVDKPAGLHVARRRGEAAQGLRPEARRARGHARPRRDRRAARRARARDAAAAVPAGDDEGLPGHDRVRRRDRHARRRGRGARPAADAGDRRPTCAAATRRFLGEIAAGPADGVGAARSAAAGCTSSRERARRSSASRGRCASTGSTSRRSSPGPYPDARRCSCECSSGTYIRSLAADLGAALGGPGAPRGAAPPAGRVVHASTRRTRWTRSRRIRRASAR